MGKSSPATPAAPDPVATADAQSNSNINTANATASLNHTNQYTPWGSQVYSSTKNDDGTQQWTSNITLSPDQQKLLEAQNGQSLGLSNLATSQMGNVQNALANPIDFSKASEVQNNPLQTSVDQTGIPAQQSSVNSGPIQTSISGGGPLQNQIAGGGQIQTGVANSGNIQKGLNGDAGGLSHRASYGQIQNGVDMSTVSQMVGGDALDGTMQRNQGAAYKQQASYLDSGYSQKQHDLENQLVQQGVTQNSDAWNRAMNNLGEQRTFDYNNAYNNSFATGLAANNQLFNQGLQTNQNGYNQALNNANFANTAQAQGFGQSLANAQLNNSAIGQQFGQNQAAMQTNNAAQAQQYGQNSNNMTQANAAQLQQFNQNQAQGQFANTAQAQEFGQGQSNAALNNSVNNSMFSQGLANAGLANQASAQTFSQSSANRARQLQEQNQQQQIPLNLLNGLRTGSQVTSPSFGGTPQGNVGGTDIASLYNNQYQGQLAGYNGQIATNNANTQAGAGLATAAISAAAMY